MESNKKRREESMRALEREIKSRDRKEKTQPFGVALASLAVIGLATAGIYWASTHESDDQVEASEETSTSEAVDQDITPLATQRTTPLDETVTCSYEDSGREASREVSLPNQDDVPARGTVTVTLDTSQGPIGMQLDRSVSPCTVNAVEHLAKEGFYDDTICHRITTSGIHVLQCGDPSGEGSGGPGFQFANEFPTDEASEEAKQQPVNYQRGTIAMANSGPDTNGSQFFLNYDDSPLPPMYTYFGTIDEAGLKTLDSIAEKGAADGASDGAPAEEVKISKATVS
ncbi:Peptidyl-prolyl cis-trans isomerase B [Corynebacterium ciconiae DSM 44920]|uniref:peptidylprolyl isomerase n=1 Tax=Corynebacterium ciconiae TaxID=227319 RepID=UPI000371DBE1|nr:peptidylprolyl isomerase [Corynebacterium ciconiae]WKD61330.1 Peptidyl-prolyl cis-trans isomerase B [Corynebacterium ciconiae DSM 44920]